MVFLADADFLGAGAFFVTGIVFVVETCVVEAGFVLLFLFEEVFTGVFAELLLRIVVFGAGVFVSGSLVLARVLLAGPPLSGESSSSSSSLLRFFGGGAEGARGLGLGLGFFAVVFFSVSLFSSAIGVSGAAAGGLDRARVLEAVEDAREAGVFDWVRVVGPVDGARDGVFGWPRVAGGLVVSTGAEAARFVLLSAGRPVSPSSALRLGVGMVPGVWKLLSEDFELDRDLVVLLIPDGGVK